MPLLHTCARFTRWTAQGSHDTAPIEEHWEYGAMRNGTSAVSCRQTGNSPATSQLSWVHKGLERVTIPVSPYQLSYRHPSVTLWVKTKLWSLHQLIYGIAILNATIWYLFTKKVVKSDVNPKLSLMNHRGGGQLRSLTEQQWNISSVA